MLNRKDINKTELMELTGISSATLARLSANRFVSLGVIDKICEALSCQPADIMEYVAEAKE